MNGQSLNSPVLKKSWGVSLQKEAQICVVGKVFRPNKSKILALNKTLSEYFKLVKWYLSYTSTSTLVVEQFTLFGVARKTTKKIEGRNRGIEIKIDICTSFKPF